MGAEQGIINYELSHAMAVLGFHLVLTAQDILPQSKCERENDTFRFEIPVNPGCNSNQQGGGISLAPWIRVWGSKQPLEEERDGSC